jgi:hypothetical protein
MSRFMSHREMKAASRVLGQVEEAIAQHSARLYVIEGVLAEMLKRAGLEVVVTADQKIELTDAVEAAPAPQASEITEFRVIEDEPAPAETPETVPAPAAETPATE